MRAYLLSWLGSLGRDPKERSARHMASRTGTKGRRRSAESAAEQGSAVLQGQGTRSRWLPFLERLRRCVSPACRRRVERSVVHAQGMYDVLYDGCGAGRRAAAEALCPRCSESPSAALEVRQPKECFLGGPGAALLGSLADGCLSQEAALRLPSRPRLLRL